MESFDVVAHLADAETKEERNLLLPAATIMIALFIFAAYILW